MKLPKCIKKTIISLLFFTFAIGIIYVRPVRAAENNDWAFAYIDFIQKHLVYPYSGQPEEQPYLQHDGTFGLIYLNDDDIPEVLYSGLDEASGMGVISYSENGIAYQPIPRHDFAYIERSGLILSESGNTGSYYTNIYKLENGSFSTIGSGDYHDKIVDDHVEFEYSWEGNAVSEQEYRAEISKLYDSSKTTRLSNNYTLPFSYNELIDRIMQLDYKYSDIMWINTFQDFVAGAQMENASEMYGTFFDMDHDGIPELSINGNIYALDNGTVKYMGAGTDQLYVDTKQGYSGSLCAYNTEEKKMYAYTKTGSGFSSSLIADYSADETAKDTDYHRIKQFDRRSLMTKLALYDKTAGVLDDIVGQTSELDDFLSSVQWLESYDYTEADHDSLYGFFHSCSPLLDFNLYPGNILEQDYYSSPAGKVTPDPKGTIMYGACRRLNGSDTDWVLKNIMNLNDDKIEALHQKDDSYLYYSDGKYYSYQAGGIGGGYGNVSIQDIEKIDEIYHITFLKTWYGDGTDINTLSKAYALCGYKTIDGNGYWSLYMLSDNPLNGEANAICEELELNKSDHESDNTDESTTTTTIDNTNKAGTDTDTNTESMLHDSEDELEPGITDNKTDSNTDKTAATNNTDNKKIYFILLAVDGCVFIICLATLLILFKIKNPFPPAHQSTGKRVIIILIALLIIAAAIITVLFITQSNKSKTQEESHRETNSTENNTSADTVYTEYEEPTTAAYDDSTTAARNYTEYEETTAEYKETTDEDSQEKSDEDFSFISGQNYQVVASKFALEWSDDLTLYDDGSFEGVTISYGATTQSTEYRGSFANLTKERDGYRAYITETELKEGSHETPGGNISYWKPGTDIYIYPKGTKIDTLPGEMLSYTYKPPYTDLVTGSELPCTIIWNYNDGSVYAEADYNSATRDVSTDGADINNAFWGVWCSASTSEAEAEAYAETLRTSGFDAKVFLTTDWENLNSNPYYVVTACVCTTQEEADRLLANVQNAGYEDAYVKYSGEQRD
ncbi:MAG: SPOR domain-containing protein [Lachnospiraceae bacterium]|nr:SPOR domain-containing protein [Lachnospiraceae bacterium]